jgi:hypothetical protein
MCFMAKNGFQLSIHLKILVFLQNDLCDVNDYERIFFKVKNCLSPSSINGTEEKPTSHIP